MGGKLLGGLRRSANKPPEDILAQNPGDVAVGAAHPLGDILLSQPRGVLEDLDDEAASVYIGEPFVGHGSAARAHSRLSRRSLLV